MLNRRKFLLTSAAAALRAAQRPPLNFVFILVDDMGAADLGCYGSRFYETPRVDAFAKQAVRFTQAYSACTVCSPSRAAILTGKYPARLHITDWIPGHPYRWAKLKPPDWTQYLPLEETTIPQMLKKAGYATASIGKWHLGGPKYYPEKHGFDVNIGGTHLGSPPSYFSPYHIPTLPDGPPGEYLPDRQTAEAVKFITSNRSRPFFLYLSHYAVHTPLQAKSGKVAKYKNKSTAGDPQGQPAYGGLVESVDESVGRILDALDDLRLSEQTAVFFTSDNGGWIPSTKNLGLRAGKGSAHEGGVRVPLLVRWPGVTRGERICTEPVCGIDFYPTILAMAGLSAPRDDVVDGVSLAPLLRGAERLAPRPLYWHYPHYHPGGATPHSAVRDGSLKLIEFHEDGRLELYDLHADPLEQQDLAKNRQQDAQRLQTRLHKWLVAAGAQMPVPNPAYDAARAVERSRG
jgi:arylsulfatase A